LCQAGLDAGLICALLLVFRRFPACGLLPRVEKLITVVRDADDVLFGDQGFVHAPASIDHHLLSPFTSLCAGPAGSGLQAISRRWSRRCQRGTVQQMKRGIVYAGWADDLDHLHPLLQLMGQHFFFHRMGAFGDGMAARF
jgi:hypothetical protein